VPEGAEVIVASRKPKEGQVRWHDAVHGGVVTDLFYALWAAPDADWQRRHLGRAALTGEALLKYVFWESGLRPKARRAWVAALDRLDPRRDLEAQLSAIHLTPPAPDAKPAPERGATMIIQALAEPKAGKE
jgi:hypothetical protein